MSETPSDYWAFWSNDVRRTGCELYARLATVIGNSERLRAIASHASQGQPPANLILAAVHFLLFRSADHPLHAFYPTLGGRQAADDQNLSALFTDFVERHSAEIVRLVETRVTNTNEVGRSALLHAGFRELAKESPRPLHLIEIGASAGLNLVWDSYGVLYQRDGKVAAAAGANSELLLECQLRSERLPPAGTLPAVKRRLGLELNPVDLSNQDDRDWLRALVFPTDVGRLNRLERAMALFANASPEIRHGDALDLLPDALAEATPDVTLCVYHTIVLYQFSREQKEALESLLTVAGLRRPLFRLSFEFADNDYVLSLIRYEDGIRAERKLAISHPHGTWIEWQA